MDVCKFLKLPISIRKNVYFFLSDTLGSRSLGSDKLLLDTIDEDNSSIGHTVKKARKNKNVKVAMYRKIFQPFFSMFEYSKLFEKWLQYAVWLRYDAIVLDSLRLNHHYQGDILGPLDWIQLDGKLRLAYFDKHFVLQVWYTYKEYVKWVIHGTRFYEITDKITYLRLNMDHIDLNESRFQVFLNNFDRKEMYLKINDIHFIVEEDETAGITEFKDDKSVSEMTDLSFKNQLSDKNIVGIIQKMELMKNLSRISVTSDMLYQTLINLQGARDNPGKIISYTVRKRIKEIQINRVKQISVGNRIGDFGKWESLNRLILNNIEHFDLNTIYLPNNCMELILKNIGRLDWWSAEEALKPLLFTNSVEKQKKIWNKTKNIKSKLKLYRLNAIYLKPETISQCKEIVKSMIGRSINNKLNYIKLSNINKLTGKFIIVPENLYENQRIRLLDMNPCINEIYII